MKRNEWSSGKDRPKRKCPDCGGENVHDVISDMYSVLAHKDWVCDDCLMKEVQSHMDNAEKAKKIHDLKLKGER